MHSPAPPKYVIKTVLFAKAEPTPQRPKKQMHNDQFVRLNSTATTKLYYLHTEKLNIDPIFTPEELESRLETGRLRAAQFLQNEFNEYAPFAEEIENNGNNTQQTEQQQERTVTFSQQDSIEEIEAPAKNNSRTIKQGVRSPRQKATVETTSSPMLARTIASPKPNQRFNSTKSPRRTYDDGEDSYIATPRKF